MECGRDDVGARGSDMHVKVKPGQVGRMSRMRIPRLMGHQGHGDGDGGAGLTQEGEK